MRVEGRKRKILEAIILDYIATGEPVGSRTIARRYNLGVSPATIRNEMADLEELGLIEQPHTSAGRIPSDLGYRYYIDCIMERHELSPAEKEYIRHRFEQKIGEIEQVLADATGLIAELTSYAAVALGPYQGRAHIQQVQLLYVSPGKALLVVVTSSGLVEHHLFSVPRGVNRAELNYLSQLLNERLKGIVLEDIKPAFLDSIYQEMLATEHKQLCSLLIELLEELSNLKRDARIFLDGTLNLFEQPEFRNIDKVKGLLCILEKTDALRELFAEGPPAGLRVKIGRENKNEEINNCSILTVTYEINGEVIGNVGVLGPTRMNYSRTISVLEYVAQELSQALEKLCG
ncbi:MAG: heat-inducible transcription repressor HrcA [Thermoanaerobacteraceae bacterium]|uniref:heat-inducible transcriptional repressor HrcA n=1 Tax=Thermanaeromonas sp. C210 TaxID=2731925 RepID=UPI00155C0322|nr:heat-inducible transcriptional repressor HrcA [Thermanaeromonas sp. C210]MBE3580126.1 heat-inducible transcription repressor HrcA [Thermoanaerobacteraceae bacterium]GFN22526.1 heat-inducible transcription repressor HrcA [Thermanaeromonas sp. C210]